jgi:SAM-dependent methyltransferase
VKPSCRSCEAPLEHTFVDLGMSPLCQKHVEPEDLDRPETFYPLRALVCHRCYLVQLPAVVPPETLFGDGAYAYFASYSQSWLAHAKAYTEAAIARFALGDRSRVVEVASNDGYLLQYFAAKGVPVLGIEPASNCAAEAQRRGIPTEVAFFGREAASRIAAERGRADLIIGNNVLAHVPDLHDFVGGLARLLAAQGAITLEFPHLLRLVEGNQFDTIYHEHYSYLGLGALEPLFARHGLEAFDVEELPTHGGSLRLYLRHAGAPDGAGGPIGPRVAQLRERERAAGMRDLSWYRGFGERVHETKRKLLEFLIAARRSGRRVAGYGAPGKGNTLLNYCGIREDFLDYTVDRSPHKQGRYLPGTRIRIAAPERVFETRPDYLLILPWNLREEIMAQMAGIRDWGGRFVVPIPEVRIYD